MAVPWPFLVWRSRPSQEERGSGLMPIPFSCWRNAISHYALAWLYKVLATLSFVAVRSYVPCWPVLACARARILILRACIARRACWTVYTNTPQLGTPRFWVSCMSTVCDFFMGLVRYRMDAAKWAWSLTTTYHTVDFTSLRTA